MKTEETIQNCKTCQELQQAEILANNDRLPIELFHEAGKKFWDHLKTHFEAEN